MKTYDPAILPPETSEIVPAVCALLEASAEVALYLIGGGRIERVRWGAPPAAVPYARILVREPVNPYETDTSQKIRWAPVEIIHQLSAAEVPGFDVVALAAACHSAIYRALVGQLPALQYARAKLPFERHRPPSGFWYRDDIDAFEQSAVYRITIAPIGDS